VSADRPFAGVTVLEFGHFIAVPWAGQVLADGGAHVVKIERPEGDFARGYDAAAKGQSSYFVWLNRDKNSVVIDLATKEGRAALEELIADAEDILRRLELAYQVMLLCTGDLSFAMTKTYDLNAWGAGSEEWLEVSSISNATRSASGDGAGRRVEYPSDRTPVGCRQRYRQSLAARAGSALSRRDELFLPQPAPARVPIG